LDTNALVIDYENDFQGNFYIQPLIDSSAPMSLILFSNDKSKISSALDKCYERDFTYWKENGKKVPKSY